MPEPRRAFQIHRRPDCLVRREMEAMLFAVAGKLQKDRAPKLLLA